MENGPRSLWARRNTQNCHAAEPATREPSTGSRGGFRWNGPTRSLKGWWPAGRRSFELWGESGVRRDSYSFRRVKKKHHSIYIIYNMLIICECYTHAFGRYKVTLSYALCLGGGRGMSGKRDFLSQRRRITALCSTNKYLTGT